MTTLDSWNNGTVYKLRESNSGKKSIPSWSAFISGWDPGDIYAAGTLCY